MEKSMDALHAPNSNGFKNQRLVLDPLVAGMIRSTLNFIDIRLFPGKNLFDSMLAISAPNHFVYLLPCDLSLVICDRLTFS